MKRWAKTILLVLLLIALTQAPFVIRRFQLSRLRSAIASVNASRVKPPDSGFTDYKGVIHVHSDLGGHSTGTLPEIVRAAAANGLNFVVMTEHPSAEVETFQQTLAGTHKGILFTPGTEVATSEGNRYLVLEGVGIDPSLPISSSLLFTQLSANNRFAEVAYPEESHELDSPLYGGIEVYNLFTNAKQVHKVPMIFDALWSFRSFPDLLFARVYQRPDGALRIYDDEIKQQSRPIALLAGNDAHQNLGFGLTDATGKKFAFVQLDPYERSFAIVRTHVLLPKDYALSQRSLLEALRNGHSFFAFDLFGDSTGFMFSAKMAGEQKIMGDAVSFSEGLKLSVATPVSARIELFKNGQLVETVDNVTEHDFAVSEPGAYRVEVLLPQLGSLVGDKPWIYSNPIYVR